MRTCGQCGKRFKEVRPSQRHCCEQCLINFFDSLVKKSRKIARNLALTLGYQSMGEVRFANDLKRNSLRFEYEPDKFAYQIKEQHYTPDFKCKNIYLEYKGKFDGATRKKMLAVKRCNPDLDVRIVFEKPNNLIRKKRKPTENVSRNWEWAEKHGFKWYDYRDLKTIKEDIKNAGNKSKATKKTCSVQTKRVAKKTSK